MDKIRKFLLRLPRDLRQRVVRTMECIASGNISNPDIRPLTGYKGCFRCRIGAIRIVFLRAGDKHIILEVTFRKDAYR